MYLVFMNALPTDLTNLPTIGTATVAREIITHVRLGTKVWNAKEGEHWAIFDAACVGAGMAELVGTVAVCVKVSRRPGGFDKARAALAKAVAAEQRRQARA